jgi:hypothetical protein
LESINRIYKLEENKSNKTSKFDDPLRRRPKTVPKVDKSAKQL